MIKMIVGLFSLILLISHCPLMSMETTVELRAAAFFPSSDRFRDIYGKVIGDIQIEASTQWPGCLESWVNLDFLSKHGKSIGGEDPTKVNIANVSFGINMPYQFCEYTFYIGIGPSFSRIWLKNQSCSEEKVSKLAYGGVLKSGVCYFLTECIFLDVFVDYLYQPVHFETKVDIGGFKIGAGLGVAF